MIKNFIKLSFVRKGKNLFRNAITVGDKLTIRCKSTFTLLEENHCQHYQIENIESFNVEKEQ